MNGIGFYVGWLNLKWYSKKQKMLDREIHADHFLSMV